MGCEVRFHRQAVAATLGRDHAIFCLPADDPESSLYDQRDRVSEHDPQESDQDTSLVPQRRRRHQAVVSGAEERRAEMEIRTGLAARTESFPADLGRPDRGCAAAAAAMRSRMQRRPRTETAI